MLSLNSLFDYELQSKTFPDKLFILFAVTPEAYAILDMYKFRKPALPATSITRGQLIDTIVIAVEHFDAFSDM